MWLYRGIIFVLLILLVISTTKEAKREKAGAVLLRKDNRLTGNVLLIYFVFFLSMVCLWGLTAFRAYNVGNDTQHYIDYFNSIAHNGPNANFAIEMGYQYFCLLISKFTKNPHTFLFIHATICYLAITRYILKYSKNVLFSLVLFFCFCFGDYTTALRQNLSVLIVLYAYQALKDKKYIKFSLMVLLATVFHTSALFAFILLLYNVQPKDIRKTILIVFITVTLCITGILSPLFAVLFSSYSSYFQGVYVGSGWLGVSYYILRNLVLYSIIHFAYIKEPNGKLNIFPAFIALMITCWALIMNQFVRGADYFIMILVVELPNALTKKKLKNENLLIILIGAVSCLYFLLVLRVRPEWCTIIPYRFYWNS